MGRVHGKLPWCPDPVSYDPHLALILPESAGPLSAHPGPWASRTPDSPSATRQCCLTPPPHQTAVSPCTVPHSPCAMRCRKTSCRRWSTGEVTWK